MVKEKFRKRILTLRTYTTNLSPKFLGLALLKHTIPENLPLKAGPRPRPFRPWPKAPKYGGGKGFFFFLGN